VGGGVDAEGVTPGQEPTRSMKEEVRDALQAGVGRFPGLDGSYVVKFAIVMELAVPDGSHTIMRLTSDASGRDLFRWESVGLLQVALQEAHR